MCSARYDRLCIQGVVNRRAISGNMPSTNQSPSQSPQLTAHIRDITAPLIGWHCCACASLTAKYEPTLHTRACEPSRISALDSAIVLGRIIRGQFSSYGPDSCEILQCCGPDSAELLFVLLKKTGDRQQSYYDWIDYKSWASSLHKFYCLHYVTVLFCN